MKYMKKKNFTQIFFIFYVLILIAIPINIISTSFPLRSYDSVDKEKPNPSDVFITTLNGKEYLAEYITREKVEEMKKQSELKISSKNYNQIIDGHGTGYAPPTAEDLEKLIGKVAILDVIPDAGFQNYGASADISTEIYFPVVGDQAMQGSCTAWANAYYAYGYMEAKDYGWDASSGNTDYLLSPAWAYNKVAAYDYGSVPIELAQLIIEWGVSTLSTMPYNDFDVDSWGEEPAWREAPYHRPLNYNPIFFVGPTTIDTIKSLLDSGTPVTIGIDAYQFDPGFDDGNYIISSSEYDSSGSLNHAQCFVGYDDSITDDGDIGAFRVVNSWGLGWGDNGYYWLTYDAFSEFADDIYQSILYYTDRIDYNPSLIGTWEFSDAPTRMDDIITLGVGTYETPLGTINPLYDNDIVNSFPEFMALDISDFYSYYNINNDVFFYLEVGPSITTGTISSFLIERYSGGVFQEITPESLDVPKDTPDYVYNTFKIFDHELKVSLEVPNSPDLGETYIVNATVINLGINAETNVDLSLYLDSSLVNSTSGVSLSVGGFKTITHTWIPSVYKTYNFTAYSSPIPGETYLENNIATTLTTVSLLDNYIMTPGAPYSWIDASGGTELVLSDDGYAAIALPFSFTFYDQTFSTIYLSANGYLSFTDTMPWQYSNVPFPSADPTHHYMIAPFWDDLYPPSGGNIYYQSFGTYWVAEWLNIDHINGFVLGTFELILYDTGEIMFNYDRIYYHSGYTCGLNLGVDTQYYNSYQGINDLTDDFSILFTYEEPEHDLSVSLDTPMNPQIGDSYQINATVTNTGLNDEFDVDLLLYLDDVIVASTIISTLPIGASETINYIWIPPDFGSYNFTAYASPVPDEALTGNNIVTKIIDIVDVQLFDGMFIDYTWTIFGNAMPAQFIWSHLSGAIFHTDWYMDVNHDYWDVDAQTRVMSNSGGSGWYFGDGYHSPLWIFTDVSIGDQMFIAVDAEGDHLFEVSSELIYDLPGFGLVEVLELEDLTFPGGFAWYEKSTGIILNGTFFYMSGGDYNYTFDFLDTNVEFSYVAIDHDIKVSSDVPINPEIGNSYMINATVTNTGLNDEFDVDLLLYLDDVIVASTIISTLPIGASETINYIWIPPDFGSYNFTAYAPPIPDETFTGNNIVTEIIYIVDTQLFDGMYIAHDFTDLGFGTWPSNVLYTYNTGEIFDVAWDFTANYDNWQVDSLTREITGSSFFTDFTHTPMWIFTEVSLGDTVLISSIWDVDHTFEVQDELIYDLPGFDWVEVWVLQDLGDPNAIAWYEKSTGILLNGTFYYAGGNSYIIFEFVDTNVQFSYITLDHELKVSLEVPSIPDVGDTYIVNATVFNNGNNDEYDVDLLLYLDDVIVESTTISSLPVGASETVSYMWTPSEYRSYNFTAYAPPVPDETFTGNNFVTKIIHIVDSNLFDGMYIDHNYTVPGATEPSKFSYSFYSGSLFFETWDVWGSSAMWYVDSQTRLMSGGSVFGDGTHTPAWIFTDVSLGDEILIAADGEGDHLFNVSNELIYDLPGFGLIEVWELEDLTFPGGIAWYEKSTGILLNGTFYYYSGEYYYIFDFIDTNAEFTYYVPPSLTVTTPDSISSWETGTTQSISWTSTGSISDVKIELYKGGVFEMEIIAITTNAGTYNWDIPTDLEDGIDYQIKISDVANPAATNDFSEDFEIFTTPVVIDSIIVTTPDSLTAWEMGTSQDIYWTSTGIISDVKIELYKDGVFEREIIASTTNDGSFDWTIPTDLVDGIDYTIRISDASNSATFGESPNFALTTADTGDGTPAIPGYDLLFLFGVIITISVVAIIKTGKRKLKLQ